MRIRKESARIRKESLRNPVRKFTEIRKDPERNPEGSLRNFDQGITAAQSETTDNYESLRIHYT